MTYVPQVKNSVNIQFGMVANADFTPQVIGDPGDGMAPLLDGYGRLIVIPATPFGPVEQLPVYDPQALESDAVISTDPAQLYEFRGYNPNATGIYVQTYDLAVPPTTAVTLSFGVDLYVPGQSSFVVEMIGLFYATGLVWGASTTPVVYTNAGTTEARFIARYGV